MLGGPIWRDQSIEVGDQIMMVRQVEGDPCYTKKIIKFLDFEPCNMSIEMGARGGMIAPCVVTA